VPGDTEGSLFVLELPEESTDPVLGVLPEGAATAGEALLLLVPLGADFLASAASSRRLSSGSC
jgi:hypothetical protein